MADLHSIKTYTATGGTQDFLVPFPFLDRSHVTITQNGTDAAFTWINDGKVTLTPTVNASDAIKFTRSTSPTSRITKFTSPSSVTTVNLNNAALQLFYMAQEALDGQQQDSDSATSAAAAATSAAAAAASATALSSNVLIWAGTATGVDTILLTPSPAVSSYTTGMKVRFIPAGANTGASTINVSSLGAKTFKTQGGSALVANDIPDATSIIEATYDGTDFILDTGATALLKTGGSLTGTLTMSGAAIDQVTATSIAVATTTDIGNVAGNSVIATGAGATITGLGTVQAGAERIVIFNGINTLVYNASTLVLPTLGDLITGNGDTATFVSLGSGSWICTSYNRASGHPAKEWKIKTVEAVGSTTQKILIDVGGETDFTNVSEIMIYLADITHDGTSQAPLIQLGDSGGIETTNYSGFAATTAAAAALQNNSGEVGFLLAADAAFTSTDEWHGVVHLTRITADGSGWACNINGGSAVAGTGTYDGVCYGYGLKGLTGGLTQVALSMSGAADTFTAGSFYVRYR